MGGRGGAGRGERVPNAWLLTSVGGTCNVHWPVEQWDSKPSVRPAIILACVALAKNITPLHPHFQSSARRAPLAPKCLT